MDDEAAGRVRRTVREERRWRQRRQEITLLQPTEQRGEGSSKLRGGDLEGGGGGGAEGGRGQGGGNIPVWWGRKAAAGHKQEPRTFSPA